MIRKILILLGLLVFLSGCETTKGTSSGIAQDAKNGWAKLEQLDQWIRENYW